MKTHSRNSPRSGFTLMELMVAMAITTIIVSVLVSITSLALDTWNRSRSELRASRQAKSMVDSLSRDLEALVTRRGNTSEWLSAISPTTLPGGNLKSTNACDLIFMTAATDRYNGLINSSSDRGGDVCAVSYNLRYADPISNGTSRFETFVLNRLLVNPDETFRDLLGKTDLTTAFSTYNTSLRRPENFICENVYQFSLTFHVQVNQVSGTTTTVVTRPVTVGARSAGQVSKEFRITGSGLISDPISGGPTPEEMRAGRVTAVEISLSVVSDFGIDQLRARNFTGAQQADFLAKNSYHYSKLVQLPSM